MLNNGNGSLQAPVYYYVGDYPNSVHAADLDADGDIDLVAANSNSNSVSVLFNNGTGTFQNITNYTTGTTPYSVYATDLDADGDMDLATANYSSNNVSVLRNNGNGTFQAKTDYTVGTTPCFVYAADLDADGDVDLATANYNSGNVSVLRNNGNGTFLPKTDYPAGTIPYSILAADLDADGDVDLATANYSSGNVSVLRNNGNGTFLPKTDFKAGSTPRWVSAADYDRDGDIDLAVTNQNSGKVSVLLNRNKDVDIVLSDHALVFGPSGKNIPASKSLIISNFGIDSVLRITDIASSDPVFAPETTTLSIPPGDSAEIRIIFTPPDLSIYAGTLTITSNDSHKSLMPISLSGWGSPVIQHTPESNGLNVPKDVNVTISFCEEMNAGTFHSGSFRTDGSHTGLHTGTFNYKSDTKSIEFDPQYDFEAGELVTVVLNTEIATLAGDTLQGTYQWSFTIEAEGGSALFKPKTDYATGNYPYSVFSADLDGDRDMDMVIPSSNTNNFSVFFNNGKGSFAQKTENSSGYPSLSVYAADLDSDGDLDMAVANVFQQLCRSFYKQWSWCFSVNGELYRGYITLCSLRRRSGRGRRQGPGHGQLWLRNLICIDEPGERHFQQQC